MALKCSCLSTLIPLSYFLYHTFYFKKPYFSVTLQKDCILHHSVFSPDFFIAWIWREGGLGGGHFPFSYVFVCGQHLILLISYFKFGLQQIISRQKAVYRNTCKESEINRFKPATLTIYFGCMNHLSELLKHLNTQIAHLSPSVLLAYFQGIIVKAHNLFYNFQWGFQTDKLRQTCLTLQIMSPLTDIYSEVVLDDKTDFWFPFIVRLWFGIRLL